MSVVPASADAFRAVADPTRRAILEQLRGGERAVSDLVLPVEIAAATLSQHLRILLEADLVRVRPEGRRRMYALNASPLRAVVEWTDGFRELTDPEGHVWHIGER